jgi:hypothetical protein
MPGFSTASIALDTNKGWVNPWMTPLPNPSPKAQLSYLSKMHGQSLKVGTYVAFQLDRNKITDIMGLRDGLEERKMVLEFQTRRYVGLVLGCFQHSSDEFDEIEDDDEDIVLMFVGGTLPPKPGCSVPIAASSGDHRCSPIQVAGFPWAGCYQYTVLGTQVTPMEVHASKKRVELDEVEFSKFDSFAVDDHRTLLKAEPGDDESEWLFRSMQIPDYPLPVKVWEDVSVGDGLLDPALFLEETKGLSL